MDPDETALMCSLIWIHADRKCTMLIFSWCGSNIQENSYYSQNHGISSPWNYMILQHSNCMSWLLQNQLILWAWNFAFLAKTANSWLISTLHINAFWAYFKLILNLMDFWVHGIHRHWWRWGIRSVLTASQTWCCLKCQVSAQLSYFWMCYISPKHTFFSAHSSHC